MCFKLIISSFGFWLSCNKYIIMGVELSISSSIHNCSKKKKKKDKHNLTGIEKSMKMNDECHFSVRVSRVHCWPRQHQYDLIWRRKHSWIQGSRACWCCCELLVLLAGLPKGWNMKPSFSPLKGQSLHVSRNSSQGLQRLPCAHLAAPFLWSMCIWQVPSAALWNYYSLFLQSFWVSILS